MFVLGSLAALCRADVVLPAGLRAEEEVLTGGLHDQRTGARKERVADAVEIAQRPNGVLIAMENGKTTGFSLFNLQERGSMFLGPAI